MGLFSKALLSVSRGFLGLFQCQPVSVILSLYHHPGFVCLLFLLHRTNQSDFFFFCLFVYFPQLECKLCGIRDLLCPLHCYISNFWCSTRNSRSSEEDINCNSYLFSVSLRGDGSYCSQELWAFRLLQSYFVIFFPSP